MTIGERIKYLRKEKLQITQEEFSSNIKISRSNLGSIETNRVTATNRVISDICERWLVNEYWLRNGGVDDDIFIILEEDIEVAKYTQEMLDDTDDFIPELIKNFIVVYGKLDENSKQILRNVAKDTLGRMKRGQS
ncbi:MAG: helix-turn-helix transcriptional regulator [Lachnospiraceae bacterium]|nr:helix-turn-helix transcriptional regulator [Lachnospiraceae bacterium]